MHALFNVVTNKEDIPHAVLIRALLPADGIGHMLLRRKKEKADASLCGGPGTLSRALGIQTIHTGIGLDGSNLISIEDRGMKIPENEIMAGPRIGVAYAGDDALLPYRFRIRHFAGRN